MDTISFRILDDLHSKYNNSRTFKRRKTVDGIPKKPRRKTVRSKVTSILKEFKKKDCDPTGYYANSIDIDDINNITECLLEKGYYVLNRYAKYYVVAFALNF